MMINLRSLEIRTEGEKYDPYEIPAQDATFDGVREQGSRGGWGYGLRENDGHLSQTWSWTTWTMEISQWSRPGGLPYATK